MRSKRQKSESSRQIHADDRHASVGTSSAGGCSQGDVRASARDWRQPGHVRCAESRGLGRVARWSGLGLRRRAQRDSADCRRDRTVVFDDSAGNRRGTRLSLDRRPHRVANGMRGERCGRTRPRIGSVARCGRDREFAVHGTAAADGGRRGCVECARGQRRGRETRVEPLPARGFSRRIRESLLG